MKEMLDLDNYIDYLMVNMFLFNQDWPANNLRCARRKDLDGKAGVNTAAANTPYATGADAQRFKFYIWDCELVMRQGYVEGGNNTDGTVGAARIHGLLLNHPTYQARWKARVVRHFDMAGGVFSIDGSGNHAARQRFDTAVADLAPAIDCEWARWGDGGVGEYSTANWQTNTSTLSPLFETRRAVFLNQLRAKNLAD